MQRIRVATYNIHKCVGIDGRESAARIADVISEFNPDVVGLQEVLSIEGGRPEDNQARYLADALRMHLAMGEVRRLRGGAYGNVVLSKLPFSEICRYDLSAPGREPRGCVRCSVRLRSGELLYLFNIHLGTALTERRWQAKRMFEAEIIRSKDIRGARVVLGDFNEWTQGLASSMLAAELKGADIRGRLGRKKTYPGICPVLHLDHIYYDEDLAADHVFLHRTLKSVLASDHLPLVADFCARDAEESASRLSA
jgi:endonuclease/exonuclease/phosphatase family metal-dependent hydrolase